MKEIHLTKDLTAIVDDEDYEVLSLHKWFAKRNHSKFYAQRKVGGVHVQMHDVILPHEPGKSVDHINGNSLDNRRCNLRLATQQEQCWNRRKRQSTTSQYKGVCFKKSSQKWEAYICINRKIKHLGYFLEEHEAAYAYDREALRLYGERARCNLSPEFLRGWIIDMSETLRAMDEGAKQVFNGPPVHAKQASLF